MVKKALTISIIIPVYNEEHYLGACLDSIARQTVKPDQVIVVDNNSTDNSKVIAQRYDFVTLLTEKHPGVVAARNKGFNAATADVLGRLDADSIVQPDWVAQLKRIFRAKAVMAATGPVVFYDMPFVPTNYLVDDFFKRPLYKHYQELPFLFGTNMAIRRDAWLAVEPGLCHDKAIFEDIDIAVHLKEHGLKLVYDSKLIGGMSSRRTDDSFVDYWYYLQGHRRTYERHGIATNGLYITMSGYLLGYLVLWPLRRSYDPLQNKRSLRHLLFGKNQPRPHPMQ